MLISAYHATGRMPPKLVNPPSILPEFVHIMKWFNDISRTRSRGFAANPISYPDVYTYLKLNRIDAHPDEIDILLRIDQEYLAILDEVAKEKK